MKAVSIGIEYVTSSHEKDTHGEELDDPTPKDKRCLLKGSKELKEKHSFVLQVHHS